MVDKYLWEAASPQKREWQSAGFGKRAVVDGAGEMVAACIKPLHIGQISVT